MAEKKLEILDFDLDTKIPTTKHLQKISAIESNKIEPEHKKLTKYEKEYDVFCRWASLPDEERKPKTLTAFESRWKIPRGYTAYFRQREDFDNRRKSYFVQWLMDKFPNVVYRMYQRAMHNSSADAKEFTGLIAKYTNLEQPAPIIQSLTLVGVPQDKINGLFTPKGYEKVEDVAPITVREEEEIDERKNSKNDTKIG